MLQWMQFIKGYVTIKVWGYSTERLMNLCGNHNILVWNVENHGDYDIMNISIKGFFAIKPLLKKTGTRVSILRKCGLPFFMSKVQKRKIFVAGILCCMMFWILTSGYIWNIKIEGNYTLTEDVLMDYLREQGVHPAMKQKDLQIEELEKSLRENYDIITWTSVQMDGTTLVIYLKENEMPDYTTGEESPAKNDDTQKDISQKGTDITATRAGMVTYMITRSGVPQVALGDMIQKGDILVSGAIPVYNEDTTVREYQFCQADADITLQYQDKVIVKKSLIYEEKIYSGNHKKILLLGVGEKEWNLMLGKIPYQTYDISGEKKQCRLLDHLYLPFYYGQKTAQEYEIVQKRYKDDEMMKIMQEEWRKIIVSLEEKGVQIIQKNVKIEKNEENWILYAQMKLEESAVKETPCAVEQIPVIPETENTENAQAE